MNAFASSKRIVMIVMSSLLLILLFSELPSDVAATTAPTTPHESREQASALDALDTYRWGLIKLVPNADESVLQAALLKLQGQGLVRQIEREASSFRILASPDVFSQLRRLKEVAQVVELSTAEPDPLSSTLRPYWLALKSTDESSTLPALLRELAPLQAKGAVQLTHDTRQPLQGESQSLKVLASSSALETLRHLPNVLAVSQHAPTRHRSKGQAEGGITGNVSDGDGNALANIYVEAYQYMPELGEWWWFTSGYTDADGNYELLVASGTYRVHFYDETGAYLSEYYNDAPDLDHATDINVEDSTISGIDASLAEAAHITGMVMDAEGNGLADISVAAYRYNNEWEGWEWINESYSNSDGSYDVGNLNAGTYRVGFFDYASGNYISEYYDNAPDLESASDISVMEGMTTSAIDASLSEGGHITGMVTDAEGNGLSQIEVDFYRYNEEGASWEWAGYGMSAEDGAYQLGGLQNGDYRVGFFDYYSGTYASEYYDDMPDLENASDISVMVGMTTSEINASLSEAGHITGMVTDSGGNPLGDINAVTYQYSSEYDSWIWIRSSYTLSDGSYDVGGLQNGDYRVGFWDDYGVYIPQYYDNQADIESATDISVTLGSTTSGIDASLGEAGHITGMVMDAEGNPLSYISVIAYQYSSEYNYWMWSRSSYTLSDGSYDVGGLPTGDYRLEFWDNSGVYIPQYYDNQTDIESASDISVTEGMTTSGIDASLSEGGHITGMVTDVEGNPLGDISVIAYQYSSEYGYWIWIISNDTLSDGSYNISGLPTGDYQLEFWDNSGQYVHEYYDDATVIELGMDVHVVETETTANIDAILAQAGHITGVVTDIDGNPLEEIIVDVFRYNAVWDSWEWIGSTSSNELGEYHLGGLTTDVYRVGFWDDLGNYASEYYDDASMLESATDVPVTVGSTTDEINAVLIESGHITGTISDADGNPLSNIAVEVYRYREDWSYWEGVGNAYSDEDGSYTVGGLNTGNYQVGFFDYSGNYISEYYDDMAILDNANDVAVSAGSTTTDIDAQLSQGGHISGLITNAEGQPVADISIDVYRYNAKWDYWEWVAYGYTGSDGMYDAGGLASDSYRVGFYDWRGRYLSEYYNDQPALESAENITVTVGETTPSIDAQLGQAGSISGSVTNVDGTPLPYIGVELYMSDGSEGWNWAGWGYTNYLGEYTVGSLVTGTYRVGFNDWSGEYFSKYYDNANDLSTASDVSVSVGEPTTGIDVMLEEGGHIKGQVSSENSGEPLAGIEVVAYRNTGSSKWDWINSTVTDQDGMYDISGLGTGNYLVGFFEGSGSYAYEYYDDQMTIEEATEVSVIAGESTLEIDALLADPAAAVANANSGSGSVVIDPQTGQLTIMQPVGNPTDITLSVALSCSDGSSPSNVMLHVGSQSYAMSNTDELFSATIPAAKLESGAQLSIDYLCGDEELMLPVGIIVLYDPSGYITDAVTDQPITGATVSLYKVPGWQARSSSAQNNSANTCESNNSKSASQTWSQAAPTGLGILAVANSGQIDPALNPLMTNEEGYYGWDVAAGCWYVVVEAEGYQTLTSPVVGVPPEVTDLDLQLTRSAIPVVYLNESSYQVSESSGSLDINVTLTAPLAETITVNYTTANGTATAGSDYTTAAGTLTFEAGDTSQTVNVTILNDSIDEANETLSLTLSSPSNATLGTLSSATVTIVDDDEASGGMKIYLPLMSRP